MNLEVVAAATSDGHGHGVVRGRLVLGELPSRGVVIEVGDGADAEEWTLTLGPATKLIRGFGWSDASLVAGDRVTSTGRAARRGSGMYIVELVKADGTVLIDELQE